MSIDMDWVQSAFAWSLAGFPCGAVIYLAVGYLSGRIHERYERHYRERK